MKINWERGHDMEKICVNCCYFNNKFTIRNEVIFGKCRNQERTSVGYPIISPTDYCDNFAKEDKEG